MVAECRLWPATIYGTGIARLLTGVFGPVSPRLPRDRRCRAVVGATQGRCVPPGACCMADYFSVIQGAVGELDVNTAAARRDIYDRARNAMVSRLRAAEPKLPELVIEAELESLNQAIERVETEHLASRGRFSRERHAGFETGRGVGLGAAPGAEPAPIRAPPPEPAPDVPPETRNKRRDSLATPAERPRRKILAP